MTRVSPNPRPTSLSYVYMAAKPNGQRRFGVRQARDRRTLIDQLRRERLVPLQTWTLPASFSTSSGDVGLKDQSEVHRQLAQLLTRGVPLVEALDVVGNAVSGGVRPRVQRIRDLVAAGSSFADAAGQVAMFDRVTLAVYKAAERSGDLGGAAKQLAVTARRQLAIRGKAGTLMVYPVIVMTISLGVIIALLTIVVPRIGQAMMATGATLPLPTRVMIGTGAFLKEQWIWMFVALAAVAVAVFLSRKAILRVVGAVARYVPLLRDVVMAQEAARFFTVMSAMTKSGITLAEALGVATDALGHPQLKGQLVTLRTRLIEGGILRQLIDNVTSLPVPTRRLLIAAERSGDLESAFELLAEDMSEELDRVSARLMAALEPTLLVVMFVVIGSLVMAIMYPIIELATGGIGG
jgi:type II secretory pathway component PulF